MRHGFDADKKSLEAFVCVLYGERDSEDINEARRKKLYKLAKWKKDAPDPSKLRKVNCALIPPCRSTLEQKMARANFVANMWMRATTPRPCQEMDPKDFGWSQTNGIYEPIWYSGLMMPTNILVGESDDLEEEEATGNESDVAAEGVDYEESSDEEEEEDCE